MAILGGSPLGLIGVRSTPTRDGMSTFNAGKSRNVNIFLYNSGKGERPKEGMASLFTGGTRVKAWPNVSTFGTEKDATGLDDSYKGVSRRALHNNDVYDTSLLNIIEKLSNTKAGLRPSDFAYLKDLGVYPNNRLMIARRFRSPTTENIYRKGSLPSAIMISWKKQDEDFFTMTFGEEWMDSKADFTGILTDMGKDFLGKDTGSKVGGGMGAIPLPGFTEGLQRAVLEKLGVFDETGELPAGNPNLIKIAKKRKTITYEESGSGLKCDFSATMVCEYEQKFISGIDPTIVWQDLLATILRFGTSKSQDYGLSTEFGKKINNWTANPSSIITDFTDALKGAFSDGGILSELRALIEGDADEDEDDPDTTTDPDDKADKAKLEKEALLGRFDEFAATVGESIGKTVSKYKEEIKGVVAALSGSPSTPWHLTIGNPLRPMFCSGDMLVESVKITPGADLAFNDLPARITVEFTIKNARPWGMQEIAKRFNTGNLRVVNTLRDSTTITPSQLLSDNAYEDIPKTPEQPIETSESTGVSNNVAGDDNKNIGKTSENSVTEVINPDAGSGADTNVSIKEGVSTLTPAQIQAINQRNALNPGT